MSVAELTSLVASLERFQIDSYLDVCAYALLVYDYILTFEREVTLVWGTNWNLTKVLFFLTRYPVFADSAMVLYHNVGQNLSVRLCNAMYNASGWMYLWGVGFAELILIIRTWAIWGRDKRIGLGLFASFLALWIVNSYFLHMFLNSLQFEPAQAIAPRLKGCLPVAGDNVLYLSYVLLMVFETIVLTFTVVRMVYTFRKSSSPLMVSFYRDGILFYIYLFVISLVNVVVILTTPHELANLLSSLQRSLHSMLSARLLLNLREVSARTAEFAEGDSGYDATGLGDMRFGAKRTAAVALTTMFNVDDGVWADGDVRSYEAHTCGSEARAVELGPVGTESTV